MVLRRLFGPLIIVCLLVSASGCSVPNIGGASEKSTGVAIENDYNQTERINLSIQSKNSTARFNLTLTPGMEVDLNEAFSQHGEYRVTVQRGDDAPVVGLVGVGENAHGERIGGGGPDNR